MGLNAVTRRGSRGPLPNTASFKNRPDMKGTEKQAAKLDPIQTELDTNEADFVKTSASSVTAKTRLDESAEPPVNVKELNYSREKLLNRC